MQEIAIEEVKPGMKSACRIRNTAGEIVVDCGSEFTAESIRRCEGIGIYVVNVLGNPVPNAERSYDAKRCFDRMPHLFRNHQENIFMRTMQAFLTRHFSERV